MARRNLFLILFSSLSFFNAIAIKGNPLLTPEDIHLADPAIFYHDGIYYLYGTVEGNVDQGFTAYTSTDLISWEGPKGAKEGFVLRKEDVYGTMGFWAPQVFQHKNKFYMAYTANENIAIAESNHPLGPFTNVSKKPLKADVKQIDPYVFFDDDGKIYLYHVRLSEGNRLFVAEMLDDFSAIKPGTLKECISAVEPWENTANVKWPVAEGPSIIKHNKLYYFIYSANDFRNPDYAVGYAVSNSPLGPWKKHEGNPVLHGVKLGLSGTGHGDLFKNRQGELLYVFHTHNSTDKVIPRKTAIIKAYFLPDTAGNPEKLVMEKESLYYPKVKVSGN
ncbi:MAG: glycoside hydrolase family 43 protein [Bacteroidota bacterium]|jgi:beta-xylosidase|nr:glycoside hydrolase family 43 protein [Bacteroidota bacterium]